MQQSSSGSDIRDRDKQGDRIEMERMDKEMKDVKENVLEIKSLLKKSTDENDRISVATLNNFGR